MPELPDLVYIRNYLAEHLVSRRIVSLAIKEPVVIRCQLPEAAGDALRGRQVRAVFRHGPFLGFNMDDDVQLIVHPMLAGRFKVAPPGKAGGRGLCLTLHLDNASAFSYLDDKRMGKVYVLRSGEQHLIPRFATQGVDIISTAFTEEIFRQLLAGQRRQVRVFLMDQTRLSAIGNAYADEILFDAGIHPKTFCQQLNEDEKHRLFGSIVQVMQWGIAEVARAGKPIDVKVRDHVRVRNRKDQPCPRCGTTIRRAGVLGQDTFFCPQCQPAKRSQFIDWGRTR